MTDAGVHNLLACFVIFIFDVKVLFDSSELTPQMCVH